MSQNIDIMHGAHTFRDSSSKVNAFVLKDGRRVFLSQVMQSVGRPVTKIPAALDQRPDFGFWYQSRFQSEGGEVLYIQVSNTVNRRPYAGAGLLLRLRDTAPLLQISAVTTRNAKAAYSGNLPCFVGRADRIDYQEALMLSGVEFSRTQIDNFLADEEELEEVFRITEVAGASAPAPEIVETRTPTGEVAAVAVEVPARRRLRFRRGSRAAG